ncbi:MAG: hypothetical protein HY556_09420 [Euryarchaeota archaeon]|nr:hypothetical protein [Euryarchaeota archaeon]
MSDMVFRYEGVPIEGVRQVARGIERMAFLMFLVFATVGAGLMFAAMGGFAEIDRPQAAALLAGSAGALLIAFRSLVWATKG